MLVPPSANDTSSNGAEARPNEGGDGPAKNGEGEETAAATSSASGCNGAGEKKLQQVGKLLSSHKEIRHSLCALTSASRLMKSGLIPSAATPRPPLVETTRIHLPKKVQASCRPDDAVYGSGARTLKRNNCLSLYIGMHLSICKLRILFVLRHRYFIKAELKTYGKPLLRFTSCSYRS